MSAAHVACGEVAGLLAQAGDPARWLSASEMQRLATLAAPARREQFLAARWLARWLLAQVAGGVPTDWPLEAPHDAPPRVAGRPDLRLSISHSGGRTACALASVPVGLDLELPRRPRDVEGLVALCCTPGEQALFAGLAASERHALFHELWTVKEAWLKQRGEWLSPRRLAQLECRRDDAGELRTWPVADGYLALTARHARWWTQEPAGSRAWSLEDRAVRA